MSENGAEGGAQSERSFTGTTAWARSIATPLQRFLSTESGSAAFLLAGALIALIWANVATSSYHSFWTSELEIRLEDWSVALDLRGWVNSGLMTLFFLVVGLEARREFDLGDLRDRRRFVLPLPAGLGGMVVPVADLPRRQRRRPGAHGWGVAMSTDTALRARRARPARPRVPERVRAFLLTVFVVDDLVALVVIASSTASDVALGPLLVALGVFGVVLVGCAPLGMRSGSSTSCSASRSGSRCSESGVDPVVVGLAIGLIDVRRTRRPRATLERGDRAVPAVPRAADAGAGPVGRRGLTSTLSPNERLQQLYHPWTSYVIVPLFALANAGIVDRRRLPGPRLHLADHARRSCSATSSASRSGSSACPGSSRALSRRPAAARRWAGPPSPAAAPSPASASPSRCSSPRSRSTGDGAAGGQARRPRRGRRRLGAHLAASSASPRCCRAATRARALLGDAEPLIDLVRAGRPERDHIRGPARRAGDGGRVRRLRVPVLRPGRAGRPRAAGRHGDIRYVWRHLPLDRRAPARPARRRGGRGGRRAGRVLADARPAAGAPGRAAGPATCCGYAEQLGLDAGPVPRRPAAGTSARPGSPRTWSPPTSAASPGRRRSSSTAGATTARTTSTPSRPRSRPPRRGPRSRRDRRGDVAGPSLPSAADR